MPLTLCVRVRSMRSTTSIPSVTLPNTAYPYPCVVLFLWSSDRLSSVLMKNCARAELGAADRAMASVPLRLRTLFVA